VAKITDAAQKRINRELSRCKGESIEALEKLADAVDKAKTALQATGADACLPAYALNALHAVHAGLLRVFSLQHRSRAFKDAIREVNA
jgi:hypothetical protein